MRALDFAEGTAQTVPAFHRQTMTLLALLLGLALLSGCASGDDFQEESLATGPGLVGDALPVPEIGEADALRDLGRYLEAAQLYQRIVQVEPENARALAGLAESLYNLGETDAAMAAYSNLEQYPAYQAQASQGQGLIHLARGDVIPARSRLQAAVMADPMMWRAWNALGRAYDISEQYAEAEEAYIRAMEIQPRSALPINNLGMSLIQQQRFGEAEGQFAQAIQVDPSFKPARANLRNALAWQGRYREALFNVPQADASATMNDVGYIAMLRGDLDVAEALFNRAIEESPSFNVQAAENLRYLESLKSRDRPIVQ